MGQIGLQKDARELCWCFLLGSMLALGIACRVASNKQLLVQARSSGDNRSWLFITNYKILHLVFCETTLVKL